MKKSEFAEAKHVRVEVGGAWGTMTKLPLLVLTTPTLAGMRAFIDSYDGHALKHP